jgi:hypothetical protein
MPRLPFTDAEKLRCLEKELRLRNLVYPRKVEAGKMTQGQANREIYCMEDIAADYVAKVRAARGGERKSCEPVTGQDLIDWKHDHDHDERKHE